MENFKEIQQTVSEIGQLHYLPALIQQRTERIKAHHCGAIDELQSIYLLTKSHVPGFRFKLLLQHAKSCGDNNGNNEQILLKDILDLNCNNMEPKNIDTLLEKLSEMPKEWTIVQLTSDINVEEYLEADNDRFHTNSINLTLFDCGRNKRNPILIKVNEPLDAVDGTLVDLSNEMNSIIVENKEILSLSKVRRQFVDTPERYDYFSKRTSLDDRLKRLVKDVQDLWLKHWRCLFIGKFMNEEVEKEVSVKVSDYFQKECSMELRSKILIILICIAKGCHFLKLTEIKLALEYCFPAAIENKSFIKNAMQFLKNLNCDLFLNTQKRYPVILIVDDHLDLFPWEMLDVLMYEPVSRAPSFHLIYLLFKTHENSIVDGYKIINNPTNGHFILNPDSDLKQMESRMSQFFNYWLPEWTGIVGQKPKEDEFHSLVTSCEIFSYMGHGSGIHLISTNIIQKMHLNAVILLFGCSSSRLIKTNPQVEMYGYHQLYLMACSPSVIGMLWEITDFEADSLTSELLSIWISRPDKTHWNCVDKSAWKKGENVCFDDVILVTKSLPSNENDLLRALSLSKKSKLFYLTKAACVARGIPVKIQQTNKSL